MRQRSKLIAALTVLVVGFVIWTRSSLPSNVPKHQESLTPMSVSHLLVTVPVPKRSSHLPPKSPDAPSSAVPSAMAMYETYLKTKRADDTQIMIDRAASNAYSVQHLKNSKHGFRLGDQILVQIDLFDSKGVVMTTGGDILRIWMTDPSHDAHVNGHVIDHNNGSYTGHLMALWEGRADINTAIAATKEHVTFFVNYVENKGLFHIYHAVFRNGLVSEVTLCNTKPMVYGAVGGICNMTADNCGLPLYCGKPRERSLNCNDWKQRKTNKPRLSPTTARFLRSHSYMRLNDELRISVNGDEDFVQSRNVSCCRRPKRYTWMDKTPTGFQFQGKWRTLKCKNNFRNSIRESVYTKCLSGHHVVLLGDSNLRIWLEFLNEVFKMNITTRGYVPGTRWHELLEAEQVDESISMMWAPHAHPFFGGLSRKEVLKSAAWYLDRIVSTKPVVVVIHIYLHLTRTTADVFRAHVRDAKNGIERLFQRLPYAKVFIKGPHSITDSSVPQPLDFIRKFHDQILREEFENLYDKVVYLDGWDITTGGENAHTHPDHRTLSKMVDHFMSYLCK